MSCTRELDLGYGSNVCHKAYFGYITWINDLTAWDKKHNPPLEKATPDVEGAKDPAEEDGQQDTAFSYGDLAENAAKGLGTVLGVGGVAGVLGNQIFQNRERING